MCTNLSKYFTHYSKQLENCSLFEKEDKPNALTIRYKDHKYCIYQTDENAKCTSDIQLFNNDRQAYIAFMNMYRMQNKPYNTKGMDMSVHEIIGIYIVYKGNRQGLWTDFGALFQTYLNRYNNELKDCSFFEKEDKPNTLCIRYRKETNLFYIYETDNNTNKIGLTYTYVDYFDATKKFIELLNKY